MERPSDQQANANSENAVESAALLMRLEQERFGDFLIEVELSEISAYIELT